MDITLNLMSVDEKLLLVRLMELYQYEFSAFSSDDMITLTTIGMKKEDFHI